MMLNLPILALQISLCPITSWQQSQLCMRFLFSQSNNLLPTSQKPSYFPTCLWPALSCKFDAFYLLAGQKKGSCVASEYFLEPRPDPDPEGPLVTENTENILSKWINFRFLGTECWWVFFKSLVRSADTFSRMNETRKSWGATKPFQYSSRIWFVNSSSLKKKYASCQLKNIEGQDLLNIEGQDCAKASSASVTFWSSLRVSENMFRGMTWHWDQCFLTCSYMIWS